MQLFIGVDVSVLAKLMEFQLCPNLMRRGGLREGSTRTQLTRSDSPGSAAGTGTAETSKLSPCLMS